MVAVVELGNNSAQFPLLSSKFQAILLMQHSKQ